MYAFQMVMSSRMVYYGEKRQYSFSQHIQAPIRELTCVTDAKKHKGCEHADYRSWPLCLVPTRCYLANHPKMGRVLPWAIISPGLSTAISTGMVWRSSIGKP